MSFRKVFAIAPFLFSVVLLLGALAIFESRVAAEDISDIRYVLEEDPVGGDEEIGQDLQSSEDADAPDGGEGTENAEESDEDISGDGSSAEIGDGEAFIEEAPFVSCGATIDTGVIISELLINPEGADTVGEFIEVYNAGNVAVDITGWSLNDKIGKIKTFSVLGVDINPGEYKVFYYSETKISLNNDGDGVVLSDQNGCKVYETLISGVAKEGVSYALDENSDWQWTIVSTPGEGNVIDAGEENSPDETEDSTAGDIVAESDGNINTGDNNTSNGASSASNNISTEEDAKIIISEFLLNPEGNDQLGEFIEVYNPGDSVVDLSGWILEDQAGKIKTYSISEGTSLKAGQYKTFYSYETGISLNNTGDGVVLKNTRQGIICKTYLSGAVSEGLSCALDEDGGWQETMSPTPGEENIIIYAVSSGGEDNEAKEEEEEDVENIQEEEVLEYDLSDKIIITEVLPNPSGSDNQNSIYEWIEVYNAGDDSVDLRGWFVDDLPDRGSRMYQIKESRIIESGGYLVISSEESKIFFNNSEDEINIIWPDGAIIDSVEYKKPKEGYSYCLFEGGWAWSEKPTPGSENILTALSSDNGEKNSAAVFQNSDGFSEGEDGEGYYDDGDILGKSSVKDFFGGREVEYSYLSISEIKEAELYGFVGTDGVVSVSPGIFGNNIFYIVEESSTVGVQIFSYGNIAADVRLGDRVQVFGYISEVGGERRLVMDDNFGVEKINGDNPLNFLEIDCRDIKNDIVGSLVKMEGEVVEIKEASFIISDGTGSARIYIKKNSGVNVKDFLVGDRVSVTGQLSRTSSGYRILPRFASDVRFLEKEIDGIMESRDTSAHYQGKSQSIYFQAFFFLSLLILLDWGKMRVRDKRNKI